SPPPGCRSGVRAPDRRRGQRPSPAGGDPRARRRVSAHRPAAGRAGSGPGRAGRRAGPERGMSAAALEAFLARLYVDERARARADLPIVARLFDDTLADYLRETLEGVTILSVSAVAAPVMAARALAVAAGPPSRLGERAAPIRIADLPDRMLLWFLGAVAVLV